MPLRVAAISFLNPAPLLYGFEHEPLRSRLQPRYALHYTSPAGCARELLAGEADLGLVPVAALTPELAVVPGCTIASLAEVRSILLLVKNPEDLPRDEALRRVRTLAADVASRSSVAYVSVLLQQIAGRRPLLEEQRAEVLGMLGQCDAALLIGDPALLAREQRSAIEAQVPEPLLWLDVAALWREWTGMPWVAAVWAVRPEALRRERVSREELIGDLEISRDAGRAHIDELVDEWTPRLRVPPIIIRTYLTSNIHYVLDENCLQAIQLFREKAADLGILPPLPKLPLL